MHNKTLIPFAMILIGIFLFFAVMFEAAAAPVEVWLTPARAAALKRVTSRSYIVKQQRLDNDTVVYTWTNGLHGAVTTQQVKRVCGRKSKSAWQTKLDAKTLEKKQLLDDIKSIRNNPSKKDIESLITKHSPKAARVKSAPLKEFEFADASDWSTKNRKVKSK